MNTSPCDHESGIKLICLYEGCEQPNLLMCNGCFTSEHNHPSHNCVRVDFLETTMAPYIKISERKAALQEDLMAAIENKKAQMMAFMDAQAEKLKLAFSNSSVAPQLDILKLLGKDYVPNQNLSFIRSTMISNNKVSVETVNEKLDEMKMMIDGIEDNYSIFAMKMDGHKRPHDGMNSEGPAYSKRKMKKSSRVGSEMDSTPYIVIPDVPQKQSSESSAANRLNFIQTQDNKCDQRVNEYLAKCAGFEQAIMVLNQKSNVEVLKMHIFPSDKGQSRKSSSLFFEKLDCLRSAESIELKIMKPFIMYDYFCEPMVKSLNKLRALKELQLDITAKEHMKDYIMTRLEKKLGRTNIHLNVHKPDTTFI